MYGQDEMVNILTEWRSSDLFNHTLGGASLNGSMDILDKEPNDSYQTFNTWLLFGDPSMLIRTDIPTEMGVTVDPGVLMLGMTEAQISVDADYAIATLSMEGEVIASGRIVDGQGTLTFPALTAPGMAQLVVIGYNKVTSVTNVEVVPAEGAYITVNNYAINANQANYGEDVDLSVNVKNVGVETASNMTATLTTENEYVEILAGEATIAEVNPDEIVTVEGFRFHVAENVPDGTVAQFFLNVTDGTNEWQGKFSINLHAPVIALDALIIAEDQVTFTFANHGSAPFNGGTLTITSCSPELVFENETITLEDVVEAGTAIDLASNYTVAETVPAASSFQVAYTFTSGSFVEEGIFTIAYQVIEETFESGVFGEGWTFSTNNAWAIVDGGVKGTKCAKSMNNGIHSTDYSMTLTVDVLAEGDMTFMYKVSSENNYDKFFFYYDGISQNPDGWSGTTMAGFEMYTKPVTVGTHTFKWEYHKDGSVSSGDDCVLIDDIKFPIVNEYIFLAPATDLMAEVSGSDVTLTWTASADATQYVIKRNGETIATVAETSYIDQLPRDGIYTYAVSAANDNGALSAPVVATVEAIFDDAAETQESLISIYPNPAKDVLNIVAGNNSIEYSLYNGMGQVVANGTATGTQQIDCSKMSKGIYFLHLNTGANAMVEKVVVK